MLSHRISAIEPSGIRRVFELAAKLRADEAINMSIGQPDFPAPEVLKKAAAQAIMENNNVYGSTQGLPALREKIAEKLAKKNNIRAEAEDVVVTAGVSGAIVLLFGAIIDSGDEVILPDPYFVLYKEILSFLGARIVYLDTYPDFHIDAEKLKGLISSKTKAIVLNTPGNPSGVVFGQEELEKVVAVAKQAELLIVADEIYEQFDYSGKFFSIGSIYPNTVTLNGFSKSHAVPGWRVGYAHGPSDIIKAMNILQMYTFVCAPPFAQIALAKTWDEIDISQEASRYRQNSRLLYEGLKGKYEIAQSEGAFYAFLKVPSRYRHDQDFCDALFQRNILAVPGSAFSRRNDYVRLSFATDKRIIESGVKILNEMV
jgi:aspartate aminotransferase/aminotransferase